MPENDRLNTIESMTADELQRGISMLVQSRISKAPHIEFAIKTLRDIQERSLHTENPSTHEKRPVNVSLMPIVLSKDIENGLRKYVAVTNLVRAAVLSQMDKNPELRAFIEAGNDSLAIEIMRKNPFSYQKAEWRWRSDTATDVKTGVMKSVENNGGEPQGDAIIADAQEVVEKVLSNLVGMKENELLDFGVKPDQQMMRVLISRYRMATGKSDIPTVGYFAFEGRSSLSESEAKITAARYKAQYGGDSVAFDPRDIVDIIENHEGDKTYYQVVVEQNGQTHTIDIIRRLHGEPMENIDLWKEFKHKSSQLMCSDQKETVWDRFTSRLTAQMINPLNSWATDKKLDVILGNPKYLEYFQIWQKVQEILNDPNACKDLSLPGWVIDTPIFKLKEILTLHVPHANMLRKQSDGLYEGDNKANSLGLSDAEIQAIIDNQELWVLKRFSLAGHSGASVHVGKNVLLHELDIDDYLDMPDEDIKLLTGMSKICLQNGWQNGVFEEDSILTTELKQRNESIASAQMVVRRSIQDKVTELSMDHGKTIQEIQKHAWTALVNNSLKMQDALIQQTVGQLDVPVALILPEDNNITHTTMHWDLDPQSIGIGTYTYPVVRVTTANKTNITGGYGALGVAITEKTARKILTAAYGNTLPN